MNSSTPSTPTIQEALLKFSEFLHRIPNTPDGHEVGVVEVGWGPDGKPTYGPLWLSLHQTNDLVDLFLAANPEMDAQRKPVRKADDLDTNESKALAALKPCPFCGGKAEFVFAPYSKRGAVRCSVCLSEARENVDGKARGVWENAEDAIAIWNRRATKSQFTDGHGVEEMADALESASKVPMDRIEWERLAVVALESQPVAGQVIGEAADALRKAFGEVKRLLWAFDDSPQLDEVFDEIKKVDVAISMLLQKKTFDPQTHAYSIGVPVEVRDGVTQEWMPGKVIAIHDPETSSRWYTGDNVRPETKVWERVSAKESLLSALHIAQVDFDWSEVVQAYGTSDEGREELSFWVLKSEAEQRIETLRTQPQAPVGRSFTKEEAESHRKSLKSIFKPVEAVEVPTVQEAIDEINEARMTVLDSMEKQSTVKVIVQYLDNAVDLLSRTGGR